MAQKTQTPRARGLRAKVNNPLLPRHQETEHVKETGSTRKELSKNRRWSRPATWSKVQSWLGWLATQHLKAGSPENISASLLESSRMILGKSTRQARKQAPPKTRKGGSQTLRFIQTVPHLRSHCSMHSKTHSEPYSNWIQASNYIQCSLLVLDNAVSCMITKVTSRCTTVVCAARKYICNLWYGQVRWITGVSTVLN